MTRQPFTAAVKECPRCGGKEHLTLYAQPFTVPPLMDDQMWTHWVLCPETKEPVMLSRPSRNFTVTWEPSSGFVLKAVD